MLPCILLVREGHARAVEVLLEFGSDVNPEGSHGRTPLDLAIGFQHNTEVIKLLIDNGHSQNKDKMILND